jgi:serine/threonine-protein kinase
MPQDGYFTSHHPANIAFAPYEQMGGNRQVTIDVYTLAASLYYAVTGKRPESSLDRKLYNKPLIPPNKYVVGISDSLNLAIIKGMNLETKNRPQSMREWLKLLPDFSNQVYQVSQKTQHQTIRTEKTFPVIVGVNNSLKTRVNSKDIPWRWLGGILLAYLTIGFLSAFITGYIYILICVSLFFTSLGLYNNHEDLSSIFFLSLNPGILIVFLLTGIYVTPRRKLQKFFSRFHQFLIILGTSWLGIFLGWLIYQIFLIFANR